MELGNGTETDLIAYDQVPLTRPTVRERHRRRSGTDRRDFPFFFPFHFVCFFSGVNSPYPPPDFQRGVSARRSKRHEIVWKTKKKKILKKTERMLFFFKENKDCNQLNSMFSRGSIWKCFVYVVGLGHSGWNQTNKNRLFFSWTEPDFIFQMESLESAVVVFEGGRRFWRRAQLCRVIHCLFFFFCRPISIDLVAYRLRMMWNRVRGTSTNYGGPLLRDCAGFTDLERIVFGCLHSLPVFFCVASVFFIWRVKV